MNRTFRLLVIFIFSSLTTSVFGQQLLTYEFDTTLYGVRLKFTAIHSSRYVCSVAVNKAIIEYGRINRLMSEENTNSEIHRINVNAGFQPVKVPNEVYDLIYRSLKLSELTNGAFDITTAVLLRHYNSLTRKPGWNDTVSNYLLTKTGHENIVLNNAELTVYLKQKGMMISLRNIMNGYAMNRMKEILKVYKINSGSIFIDRQVSSWGNPINEREWVFGAPDPFIDNDNLKLYKLNNLSMFSTITVTKKNEINAVQKSVGMHPKTGLPVNEVKGVTIICPDAEIADAIAFSVAILGVSQGLKLIDLLEGVEGIIVDNNRQQYVSKNIEQLIVPWVNK